MTYGLTQLLERYPQLQSISNNLEAARDLMIIKAKEGRLFLVAGNGGSSADADHIVGELMKSFVRKRPIDTGTAQQLTRIGGDLGNHIASNLEGAVRAICLSSHQALSTAFMNDVEIPHLCTLNRYMGMEPLETCLLESQHQVMPEMS
jgi:D-sedoheptulose 7-phosphate isomerase